MAWFTEASNLRTFALWNIWFWFANQLLVPLWFVIDKRSWDQLGVLYIATISVAALWLSSLAWWQSTRVEERQIDAEE
jgi:hypothetical protein